MSDLLHHIQYLERIINQEKDGKSFNLSSNNDEDLIQSVNILAEFAFLQNDYIASNYVHKTLNTLLKTDFEIPSPRENVFRDRSATLFLIKNIFISRFLNFLERQTIDYNIEIKPESDLEAWWTQKLKHYQANVHPLFSFLESESTLYQFKDFLKQDANVHVPFHDIIASIQIGTKGRVKVEFLDNLNDEVGNGKEKENHLDMFEKFVHRQDLKISSGEILWQAFACANILLILSKYRSLFYVGIGYLGCLEYLTPARFSKIIAAGKRLGLSIDELSFYIEHSECDTEHAEGWLKNIILPIAGTYPEAIPQIVSGLNFRLNISKLFWDASLEHIVRNKL